MESFDTIHRSDYFGNLSGLLFGQRTFKQFINSRPDYVETRLYDKHTYKDSRQRIKNAPFFSQ